MTRPEAWQKVADFGGRPTLNVTKRTEMLVVGYQDARRLAPGKSLSRKARKAADLRATGQIIEIVPETDFLQLFGL